MTNRHKILFHLLPDAIAADAVVSARLKDIPQGQRNKAARAMLVAGAALTELDPRLPDMLAALLRSGVTRAELVACLATFLPVESHPVSVTTEPEKERPPSDPSAFLDMMKL